MRRLTSLPLPSTKVAAGPVEGLPPGAAARLLGDNPTEDE